MKIKLLLLQHNKKIMVRDFKFPKKKVKLPLKTRIQAKYTETRDCVTQNWLQC